MLSSPRTSIAGLFFALGFVAQQPDIGLPPTVRVIALIVAAVGALVAFVVARDNHRTSEDVGAAKVIRLEAQEMSFEPLGPGERIAEGGPSAGLLPEVDPSAYPPDAKPVPPVRSVALLQRDYPPGQAGLEEKLARGGAGGVTAGGQPRPSDR